MGIRLRKWKRDKQTIEWLPEWHNALQWKTFLYCCFLFISSVWSFAFNKIHAIYTQFVWYCFKDFTECYALFLMQKIKIEKTIFRLLLFSLLNMRFNHLITQLCQMTKLCDRQIRQDSHLKSLFNYLLPYLYCPIDYEPTSIYPFSPSENAVLGQPIVLFLIPVQPMQALCLIRRHFLVRVLSNRGPFVNAYHRLMNDLNNGRQPLAVNIDVHASLSMNHSNEAIERLSSIPEIQALFVPCLPPTWIYWANF